VRQRLSRDALTGLFNRGHFDEVPAGRARRREGATRRRSALAIIDVDKFKEINDGTVALSKVDRALQLIGRTLAEQSRAERHSLPLRLATSSSSC
jgi:diguanylate cyclase (GGDEF)-like protein